MSRLLDQMKHPRDVKRLKGYQLRLLAQEVRQCILDTVAQVGGHFAPCLGTVELTIALMNCLDLPKDSVIWDVGHQTYAYKILTGRRDRMKTIRQFKGLSGFSNKEESPDYDLFTTGHASVSISHAMGVALARAAQKKDSRVVAVIGDGSMTGGVAFEALNNAGSLRPRLLVVLNDNKMSISENVGAISHYFNRLITHPIYNRMRRDAKKVMHRIPKVGQRIKDMAIRMEEGLKGVLIPGTLFEELGFRYFGPVDGHDLKELTRILRRVLTLPGPVLLHVVTQKGKGYPLAEKDPIAFHGMKPFDPVTGKNLAAPDPHAPPQYTKVFGDTVLKLAKRDPRLVVITAAMCTGTGLDRFAKEMPDRFFDVGIAEQHAVAFAGGMAREGLKPICAIYSTFLQRAYDQVIEDVCVQDVGVIFCMDRAGVVGEDGVTHQGVYDIAYLRAVPGMTLMAPKDEAELVHMMYTATQLNGPVAIRYPKDQAVGVPIPEEPQRLEVGKAEILQRGQQVALVAYGAMVPMAQHAAQLLEAEGVHPWVVNARFAKPLDEALILELARQCQGIVTLEDGVVSGGFGSAVQECLSRHNLVCPVRAIGVEDRMIPHGARSKVLADIGLSAPRVADEVRKMLAQVPA